MTSYTNKSKFLNVVASAFILMLCCSDSAISPFDANYEGDYKAEIDISQSPLFAFIPFTVTLTNAGKDTYLSFSISGDAEALDSGNSYCSSLPDAQMYFKEPYTGTISFLGRRHNGIIDTFDIDVDVKSPLYLHEYTLENDTSLYEISIPDGAEPVTGSIREIRWIVNGQNVKTSSADEPYNLIAQSTDTVEAVCVDWYGNQLTLSQASKDLHRIKNVDYPRFLSVTEKLSFEVELSSFIGDTGILYSVIEADTVTVRVCFSDTTETAKVQINNAFGASGDYLAEIFYKSLSTGYQTNTIDFHITASDKPYFSLYSDRPSQPLFSGKVYSWTVESYKKDGSPITSPGRYTWLAVMGRDTLFDGMGDTLKSISLRIPREGELIVSAYFQDINLNRSSVVFDTCTAVEGALGTAGDITVTPWPVYTGQAVTLMLPVTLAEDNTTGRGYWSFNGDTLWEKIAPGSTAEMVFKTPGRVLIHARYENSASSNEYSCSLTVLDGSPGITGVSVKDTDLYSSSPINVQIDARVPFGSIQSYIATIKSGSQQKTVSSPITPLDITSGFAGSCTLSVGVTGPGHDTVTYENSIPLVIKDGSPVIDSVIGDSARVSEEFTLKVAASDIDGNLSRMVIDWSDGVVDTIPLSGSKTSISAGHTFYSAPDSGEGTVSITAEDFQGLHSETFEKRVHITDFRPKPLLKGDTLVIAYDDYRDTLKIKVDQDTLIIPEDYISLNPEFYDNFIFFSASSPENNKVDLFAYSFDTTLEGSALNWTNDSCFRPEFADDLYSKLRSSPVVFRAWCKDENGTIGFENYFMRVDRAPTALVGTSVLLKENEDGTQDYRISWTGGNDSEDKDSVNILIQWGGNNRGRFASLKNLASAPLSEFETDSGRYYFDYNHNPRDTHNLIRITVTDRYGQAKRSTFSLY